MFNFLSASFFESYGLIIILVVAMGIIVFSYYFKNKKYQETENQFQTSLKVGDNVKTYSGFYGEVSNIRSTTDGKVVTLKLGEGAYIDVDIRALMGIDNKTDVSEVEDNNIELSQTEVVEPENKVAEVVEPEKNIAEEEKVAEQENVVTDESVMGVKPKKTAKKSSKK